LFLIVVVVLVNAARLQAQSYGIADLGALPGNSTSKAYGLNNLGQAAGVSDSGAAIATLFRNGTATNMNTLNASNSKRSNTLKQYRWLKLSSTLLGVLVA
jgi:hypothetical protein